ncbi:hypothetical protein ACFLSE_07990, partial [Bacteroidota bacterium]
MKKVIIIFCLISYIFFVYSQEYKELGSPFIHNYLPEDYPGFPQIWSITQDNSGIMYFGNNNGLTIYNGTDWQLIRMPNSSVVYTLVKGKDGRIFVGAQSEFGYLAYDSKGGYKYISLLEHIKEEDKSKINGNIRRILVTSHGVYFSVSHYLFRYHNEIVNCIDIGEGGMVLSNYVFNDCILVRKGKSGIYAHDGKNLKALPQLRNFNDFRRIQILPTSNNDMLIISRLGIFKYKLSKIVKDGFIRVDIKDSSNAVLTKVNNNIQKYLSNNQVYTSIKSFNGNYAFATLNGGVLISDSLCNIVQVINNNRGLNTNIIFNLFEDMHSNLWVATNSGFACIETATPITHFNKTNGINELVLSLKEYQGIKYAGLYNSISYLPDYE